MSAQQSSPFTTSAGQLGLGMMAEIDDVTTTRPTPLAFAASNTFVVPLIAGSRSTLYGKKKKKRWGTMTKKEIEKELQLSI